MNPIHVKNLMTTALDMLTVIERHLVFGSASLRDAKTSLAKLTGLVKNLRMDAQCESDRESDEEHRNPEGKCDVCPEMNSGKECTTDNCPPIGDIKFSNFSAHDCPMCRHNIIKDDICQKCGAQRCGLKWTWRIKMFNDLQAKLASEGMQVCEKHHAGDDGLSRYTKEACPWCKI